MDCAFVATKIGSLTTLSSLSVELLLSFLSSAAMSEKTIWRIQFLNNRWKFGTLFAGDIKLITADLFVGANQFILSLHVYSIFSFNQNNCKILVHLIRVYTSDGLFVAQRLL